MMTVTCPVCNSVLAPDPRDPRGADHRKRDDNALRSFVARAIRDEADNRSPKEWEAWVNALPLEEFVEMCAHDWDAEPMPALAERYGLPLFPADGAQ
jgi:hypothetical protein